MRNTLIIIVLFFSINLVAQNHNIGIYTGLSQKIKMVSDVKLPLIGIKYFYGFSENFSAGVNIGYLSAETQVGIDNNEYVLDHSIYLLSVSVSYFFSINEKLNLALNGNLGFTFGKTKGNIPDDKKFVFKDEIDVEKVLGGAKVHAIYMINKYIGLDVGVGYDYSIFEAGVFVKL